MARREYAIYYKTIIFIAVNNEFNGYMILSPSYNNSRCVYPYMFIFFLSPVLWLPL